MSAHWCGLFGFRWVRSSYSWALVCSRCGRSRAVIQHERSQELREFRVLVSSLLRRRK